MSVRMAVRTDSTTQVSKTKQEQGSRQKTTILEIVVVCECCNAGFVRPLPNATSCRCWNQSDETLTSNCCLCVENAMEWQMTCEMTCFALSLEQHDVKSHDQCSKKKKRLWRQRKLLACKSNNGCNTGVVITPRESVTFYRGQCSRLSCGPCHQSTFLPTMLSIGSSGAQMSLHFTSCELDGFADSGSRNVTT